LSRVSPRWVILTQYYPPEIGAPQIRLRCLARELTRHGIEVEVLTGMPNYPAGKIFPRYVGRKRMRERIDGVLVRRTWTYAGTGRSIRIRLANYLSFTLSSLLGGLFGPRPDLLFVESQPLSLGVNALLMKWLRGVPYIYNVPDLQIDVARQLGFMSSEIVLWLATKLENLCLRESWKVSTVTHGFIEHFEGRDIPRKKITFLPNGADTEFLRPQPPWGPLLDRWNLHGKRVFLYVGTHAFYHGLDTLIDAATLLRERQDIAILMIGDGPERTRLRRMVEDRGLTNVVFGESPYEEMCRLYSIAYASVATLRNMSVASGMRLSKIFPSLSCGVPVIYAGFGEASDLITQEGCGLVVPPESPVALAAAMTRLAADPFERDALGRRGRSIVETRYSWSNIVRQWLEEVGYVAQESSSTYARTALEGASFVARPGGDSFAIRGRKAGKR
jgi:colanic acid biosynthesis glycosyl transferase WcaI